MITGQAAADDTTALLVTALGKVDAYFRNQGANTVFLGPAGVTISNGFPLAINESIRVTLRIDEVVHAVCAAAETATVAYSFTSAY